MGSVRGCLRDHDECISFSVYHNNRKLELSIGMNFQKLHCDGKYSSLEHMSGRIGLFILAIQSTKTLVF